MPLLNTGKQFAEDFLKAQGVRFEDKDGNEDKQRFDDTAKEIAKVYDAMFQYMCDKVNSATVTTPSAVTATHIAGGFTGTTIGTVNIKIT